MKHWNLLNAAAAFLIYLGLSLIFFGRSTDWTSHYLGTEMDPIMFIWFLHWWPFAIAHGLNPFISHFVWAPQGDNFAWRTSVPIAALLTLPATLLGGPIFSFNLLAVLAPALSAFTAFLLTRHITRKWAAALLGGFFFGFSSFELGHIQGGGIDLTFCFVMPLIILLCVRRVECSTGRMPFIVLLALLLLLQLSLSTETLLTFFVFGAIIWALFLIAAPASGRSSLYCLVMDIGFAGLITFVLAAPFFYYIIIGLPAVPNGLFSATDYSADLLNYILPTALTRAGWPAFTPIAGAFTATKLEQGAYLGPPLLLLMALYFLQTRRERLTKILFTALIILIIASLGPVLQIAGQKFQLPMPWRLAGSVPLLDDALPCRFTMYVALISAIVVACFLSAPGKGSGWRFVLAIIAGFSLLPNTADFPWSVWPVQPFFKAQNITRVIGTNRTVILLPFWINGPGMAWQLQAGMSFRQASGYTGYIMKPELAFPIVNEFLDGEVWPGFGNDLTAYCAIHHVDDILIGPGTQPAIAAAIAAMGWQLRSDHGVDIVTVPPVSSLVYFYLQGDYWPWAASGNWMGRQITVVTHGMPIELVLTGTVLDKQPLLLTQTGPSGRQIFLLRGGQVKTIQIPANTRLDLAASTTFVPERIIHNGDVRHLSVQVSLRPVT